MADKQLVKSMKEQSGIKKISHLSMGETGQNIFIALENTAEKVIGWCDAVIDKSGKIWRCPIIFLNGSPFPQMFAECQRMGVVLDIVATPRIANANEPDTADSKKSRHETKSLRGS